jgi:hypothetical protein
MGYITVARKGEIWYTLFIFETSVREGKYAGTTDDANVELSDAFA